MDSPIGLVASGWLPTPGVMLSLVQTSLIPPKRYRLIFTSNPTKPGGSPLRINGLRENCLTRDGHIRECCWKC